MKSLKKFRIELAAAAALVAIGMSLPAAAKDVIIHAGRLIDGVTKEARAKQSILITDNRITAIESGFTTKPGAEVIDLSTSTVLPGMIDTHQHCCDSTPAGVEAAQTLLQLGFTSFRNPGGGAPAVITRNAVNNGTIIGPRMWVAGTVGPTAGHSDNRRAADLEEPDYGDRPALVNSAAAARRAVRAAYAQGVDLIKIHPSGGAGSISDDPRLQLMSNDEIQAAIDTAHSLGMKVAGHTMGTEAINNSLRLGIDSIDHGSYGDAESYRLYKEHGAYLVPTLARSARGSWLAKNKPETMDPIQVEKRIHIDTFHQTNFANAYKAGVKIAFGTDLAPDTDVYNILDEFEFMAKGGMTPIDIIISATSASADLIGYPDQIGSIAQGRLADIIAVAGDPLTDLNELKKVTFVMKDGAVYRRDGKSAVVASLRH